MSVSKWIHQFWPTRWPWTDAVSPSVVKNAQVGKVVPIPDKKADNLSGMVPDRKERLKMARKRLKKAR